MTVLDGYLTVLRPDAAPDRLVRVVDLPMALSGLSHHNVLNALAGAAAALGLGIDRAAVVEGLRTFRPDDVLNPGRMNTYTAPVEGGDATVVIDLAHNEAGLEALLDVARGLVAPGGRVHLALGTAGDRTDEILQALGEIAGLRADHVVAAHKDHYLRGRTPDDLEAQLRIGLANAGVGDIASYPTELSGLQALLEVADDGDVVAVMCHAERAEIVAWLHERGAHLRRPRRHPPQGRARPRRARVRGRDRRAVGPAGCRGARRAAAALYAAHPGDARIAYEYAGTHDSAGDEAAAVPLYEEALAAGLREPHRHRAQVQLASSLRNLGRLDEAVAVIDDVAARHPDSLGVAAFRALVHHDAGGSTRALSELLAAVASTSTDPDVVRYRRALTAYAASFGTEPGAVRSPRWLGPGQGSRCEPVEHLVHVGRGRGLTAGRPGHQGQEPVPSQRLQAQLVDRPDARRAGDAAQERDLAEGARPGPGGDGSTVSHDLGRAGDHDVEPVAGVALAEDRLAGRHDDVVELAGDRLEGGQRQRVEQRDPPQQGQLVVAARR